MTDQTLETPPDQTLEKRRSVSVKLFVLSRQLRASFDQRASSLGVTRSQWSVLVAVGRIPGSTQRTIANKLEMSEASTGRLIDRLCADGLLERRRKNDDRRAHIIFLTDAGRKIAKGLEEVARASEADAFANIPEDELKQCEAILDKVGENLGGALEV